jgi:hypothetical protein
MIFIVSIHQPLILQGYLCCFNWPAIGRTLLYPGITSPEYKALVTFPANEFAVGVILLLHAAPEPPFPTYCTQNDRGLITPDYSLPVLDGLVPDRYSKLEPFHPLGLIKAGLC